MIVYVGLNVKKLVMGDDNDLASEEFLQRHEELEGVRVPWDQLKLIFSPSIKRVRDNKFGEPFIYNEDTRKYLELEFAIHETIIDVNGKTPITTEG